MNANQIGRLAMHVEASLTVQENLWEDVLQRLVDDDPELPSYKEIDEKWGLLLDALIEHLTGGQGASH